MAALNFRRTSPKDKMRAALVLTLAFLLVLTACTGSNAGRSAVDFLPEDEAYSQIDMDTLSEAMEYIGTLEALLSGDPLLAAKVRIIGEYIQCMSKTGSAAMRFYKHKEYPQILGVVLAVNINRATNVVNVGRCMADSARELLGDDAVKLEPCADVWTYEEEGTTYAFFYAGTSPTICENFFAKSLPR